MSRRQSNTNVRRFADSGAVPLTNAFRQKSQGLPLLPVGLVLLGGIFLLAYSYSGSGSNKKAALFRIDAQSSCSLEVLRAFPLLSKVYGDSMQKILHVGPDTCTVVSKLLKEDDTEVWGIEPYDLEDAGSHCRALVRKGIVRVADIKFPLPYKEKSFSVVIVSDALDYLSPKYLNKTVPELARVSKDGLVLLVGYPGHHGAKVPEMSKFGRPDHVFIILEGSLECIERDPPKPLRKTMPLLIEEDKINGKGRGTSIGFEIEGIHFLPNPDHQAKLRSQSWWVRYFTQMDLQENQAVTKKFEEAATKIPYVAGCQIFHLKS